MSGAQFVAVVKKLLSTFSRILLQRIKHFRYKLAEKSFFTLFDQNLERKETFEKNELYFSSHTDYFFGLKWLR